MHDRRLLLPLLFSVCLAVSAPLAHAQAPALIDAPPPPAAPNTLARDSQQRATMRAVRAPGPMKIDGHLDEEVYRVVPPAGGFIQQVPSPGAPATETTDLWVFFDDKNLYVSLLLHETHPERRIATERRRDNQALTSDDNIMMVIDTFYDRRNAYNFQVNGVGGFRDQMISDANANGAWNTVWDVKVADVPGGQGVEIVIPFKSLRYKGSGPQVWGFNVRRITKWKNETSYLNPNPVAYGSAGILRMYTAATLVGVETPAQSANLEIKPYGLTTLTTDRTTAKPYSNKGKANAGIDAKYGITRSLTADFTLNTDFAQVEEDVQQVNLTRFSQFFPEKRDFFLEGLGNFAFAGQGAVDQITSTTDVPTVFFSRTIGLVNGQAVPVRAGARATGRAGGFEIGLLNIETGDKAELGAVATNFSAVRLRRNILHRSNVGVLATVRDPSVGVRNTAVGVDANLRFTSYDETNLYFSKAASDGAPTNDDGSYRAKFAYALDKWGLGVERLQIGSHFDPQMGFVRRKDYRASDVNARFSPRLRKSKRIRQLTWQSSLNYIQNSAGSRLLNRDSQTDFISEFHNSDKVTITYLNQYEFLPNNFRIATGVTVPKGPYDHQSISGSYALGQQRMFSGTLSASRGRFYEGTRTTAGYSGRVGFSSRFVVEPGITFNKVSLPWGDFSANLVNARFVLMPSPRMQAAALMQYNPSAHTLSSSARLRWEYTPGSELFVVLTDGRNTAPLNGTSGLQNRSLAVKVTRLLRF